MTSFRQDAPEIRLMPQDVLNGCPDHIHHERYGGAGKRDNLVILLPGLSGGPQDCDNTFIDTRLQPCVWWTHPLTEVLTWQN